MSEVKIHGDRPRGVKRNMTAVFAEMMKTAASRPVSALVKRARMAKPKMTEAKGQGSASKSDESKGKDKGNGKGYQWMAPQVREVIESKKKSPAKPKTRSEDDDGFPTDIKRHDLARAGAFQTPARYLPPAPPKIDTTRDLNISLMNVDYRVGKKSAYYSDKTDPTSKEPILRFFGNFEDGFSVLLDVRGFKPYLFARVPIDAYKPEREDVLCREFGEMLEEQIASQQGSRGLVRPYVYSVKIVNKESMQDFAFEIVDGNIVERRAPFFEICLAIPTLVTTTREILLGNKNSTKGGVTLWGKPRVFELFECNILFARRAMIDLNLQGSGWITLPANTYRIKPPSECHDLYELELETNYKTIIARDSEVLEWSAVAPLRVISFDIECAGQQGHFPVADEDPVIKIGCAFTTMYKPIKMPGGQSEAKAKAPEPAKPEAKSKTPLEPKPDAKAPPKPEAAKAQPKPEAAKAQPKPEAKAPKTEAEIAEFKRQQWPVYHLARLFRVAKDRPDPAAFRSDILRLAQLRIAGFDKCTDCEKSDHRPDQCKYSAKDCILCGLPEHKAIDCKFGIDDLTQVLLEWVVAPVRCLGCGQSGHETKACVGAKAQGKRPHEGPCSENRVCGCHKWTRSSLCTNGADSPYCQDKLQCGCVDRDQVNFPALHLLNEFRCVKDSNLSRILRDARKVTLRESCRNCARLGHETKTCPFPRDAIMQDMLNQAYALRYEEMDDVQMLDSAKRGEMATGSLVLPTGSKMDTSEDEPRAKSALDRALANARAAAQNAGGSVKGPEIKASKESEQPLVYQCIFSLLECAPIEGAEVFCFNGDEVNMLRSWREFMVAIQPDVATGYNIANFDLPYLLNRAAHLGIKEFPFLSRLMRPVTAERSMFGSKGTGKQARIQIDSPGLLFLDVFRCMVADHKLESYTLNAVCLRFLDGMTKDDIHWSLITPMHNGPRADPHTRRKLAIYCLKDALLPIKIMRRLHKLTNLIGMARVSGLPVQTLIDCGQGVKSVSLIIREGRRDDLVMPYVPSNHASTDSKEKKCEGATVIEPKRGFYTSPVATEDFASLYPSIIMAHNLCYSTRVKHEDTKRLPADSYETINDKGHVTHWIKSHVRVGMLTRALDRLLKARKLQKKRMGEAEARGDYELAAVLDGYQGALKIASNSVYGFTGAFLFPCVDITAAVTLWGRLGIELCRKLVETTFTKANGYDFDAVVIYGDTDSIMILFGPDSVKVCFMLAIVARAFCNAEFQRPMSLEVEKVYKPYCLQNKKRYYGWKFLIENWLKAKTVECRGLENVRRDNSPLVRRTIDTMIKMACEGDREGMVKFAQKTALDLVSGKFGLEDLITTRSIAKDFDDYKTEPWQVTLAKSIEAENPGTGPRVGDRLGGAIVKAEKKAKMGERYRDPARILRDNLELDYWMYFENQFLLPVSRLIYYTVTPRDKLITDLPAKDMEPVILASTKHLFAGVHSASIRPARIESGPLAKFLEKKGTCLGCNAPIAQREQALCQDCEPNRADIYMACVDKLRDLEQRHCALRANCHRCVKDWYNPVICSNTECPVYYTRERVHHDLNETRREVDLF